MIWPTLKLEQLAACEQGAIKIGPFGSQLKKAELVDSGIHVIGIENVLNNEFDKLGNRYISEEKFKTLESVEAKPGDILITMMGTIGEVAVVPKGIMKSIMDSHLLRFRPNNKLCSAEYVAWIIKGSAATKRALHGRAHGAIMKGLNSSIIKALPAPLPSLSEQNLIVTILDRADAIRKKRAEADAKAERILPVLFYKMFGDPLANPKNLNKRKLSELLKVKSGDFLPAKDMEAEGHYPVYGGNGINGYHSEYMFEHPLIVIGRVGVYCGVVYYTEPKSWVTDNALYVAEHSNELNPIYLAEALRVANLNQYAGRAGQPLISGSRIYPVEILVPSMLDQELFARRVDGLNRYRLQQRNALSKIDELFSVLMHRAFSGELTAKWREAHMKELLAEMEEQARYLSIEASA